MVTYTDGRITTEVYNDQEICSQGLQPFLYEDGGDTWCHVVRIPGGKLTTHYTGVREYAPGKLYFVYDEGLWREGGRGGRGCNVDVKVTRM